MTTTVGNIRDGIRQNDVYVGRAGHGFDGYFGNPYSQGLTESRESVIARFRTHFLGRVETDPVFERRVRGLVGKRLLCFCNPLPCHADVIAEFLNTRYPDG